MTKTNGIVRKCFAQNFTAICILMLGSLAWPLATYADNTSSFSGPGLTSAEISKIIVAATSSNSKKKASKKSKRKKKKSKRRTEDFDHLLTGFSLFGSHVNADCETCHLHEIFKGTPRKCEGCHGFPGQRASTTKPINHVITNQPCDFCHNNTVWTGARFDHATVAPGSCLQCHNGSTAEAKPVTGHPVTTESCEVCHSIGGAWLPAGFNHATVAPGTCLTCHCVTATCKPSGHVATGDSCDLCHRTSAWSPANSHGTGVAPGSCKSCHTYEAGHFFIKTAPSCDDCHYDDRWTPLRVYNHLAVSNHSPSIACDTCHLTNTDDANWTFPTYRPFCAGCHFNDWESGPHEKYPGVKYTIDELRDCTTSCHVYTDSSLTVIDKDRPGKHLPSAPEF